ncbi:hypothetical protein NL676_011171 [Syzygium grande]|nr:hypothetical protein NL676_011171 [Syzygium grande]
MICSGLCRVSLGGSARQATRPSMPGCPNVSLYILEASSTSTSKVVWCKYGQCQGKQPQRQFGAKRKGENCKDYEEIEIVSHLTGKISFMGEFIECSTPVYPSSTETLFNRQDGLLRSEVTLHPPLSTLLLASDVEVPIHEFPRTKKAEAMPRVVQVPPFPSPLVQASVQVPPFLRRSQLLETTEARRKSEAKQGEGFLFRDLYRRAKLRDPKGREFSRPTQDFALSGSNSGRRRATWHAILRIRKGQERTLEGGKATSAGGLGSADGGSAPYGGLAQYACDHAAVGLDGGREREQN